jgi:MerR family transcriptional regulator/heat shock protein HspR
VRLSPRGSFAANTVPDGQTAADLPASAVWLSGPYRSREVTVAPLPLDDANMPLFTVGQVSEMLEVQQAFLRRLDEFRVVRPSRSAGGQRRYTRNEIVAVRYVVELIDDGLTLAAIRRVLELEARVRELEAERDALRAELARLAAEA